MPASELPGQQGFRWLRSPALRAGVMTGVYLSMVLVAWLLIANYVPWSARFGLIRNAATAALFVLLMLIPIWRYLRSPGRLFAAGVAGWTLLSLVYLVLGWFFHRLHSRMGPFHVFVLGVVIYGFVAVFCWVVSLVLAARPSPLATPRRRSP